MSNKRKSWGIFMKNDKNKCGHNRTPLVYCYTEQIATTMLNDKEYVHFNPKYREGYLIKEIVTL
jgi:hypothetical protein